MMKAIIIDDRPGRQLQMLKESGLTRLREIDRLNVSDNVEAAKLITRIEQGDCSLLVDYKLVAIHRSALSPAGIATIRSFCEIHRKALLFFSGGINQYAYSNDKFEFLLISSVDFYHADRLHSFLEAYCQDENPSMLQIALGENVRLSGLLAYRQLTIRFLHETDDDNKDTIQLQLMQLEEVLNIFPDSVDSEIDTLINLL